MNCLTCNKVTNNPRFCSRTCAVSFNNKAGKTGRKKIKAFLLCQVCGKSITGDSNNKRKRCEQCLDTIKTSDGHFRPIAEISKGMLLTNDTQKYRRIRNLARIVAERSGILRQCRVCGYSKHVECCHVKPIRDFLLKTPVQVINDPSNLIGLCPTHHWEFDNGILVTSYANQLYLPKSKTR